MPYNNVIVIGYNELTMVSPQKVADASFTTAEEKGGSTVGVNYMQVRALKNDAAKAQLLNFGRVAEIAREKIDSNSAHSASTTLKLFVAPEFLFKAKSKGETVPFAFSHEDRDAMIKALAHMFSGSAYKDWVIAPGTILWAWKLPDPSAVKDKVRYAGMNTGIIIDGGNNRYVSCTKRYASDDDFEMQYQPQRTLTESDREIIYEKAQDLVLDKDGRRIAMEICKDHDYRHMVLKRAMLYLGVDETDHSTTTTAKPLDFHLLICAGMSLIDTSVIAKKGGFVIRCDGFGLEPAKGFEVHKVNDQRYRRDNELVELTFWTKAKLEQLKDGDTGDRKLFTKDDEKLLKELGDIKGYIQKQTERTSLASAEDAANYDLPGELATRKVTKGKPSLVYTDLIAL